MRRDVICAVRIRSSDNLTVLFLNRVEGSAFNITVRPPPLPPPLLLLRLCLRFCLRLLPSPLPLPLVYALRGFWLPLSPPEAGATFIDRTQVLSIKVGLRIGGRAPPDRAPRVPGRSRSSFGTWLGRFLQV